MTQKMHKILASVGCALFLVSCARSVEVLTPPTGDPPPAQVNPVTFTVELHPRADVSTFRATINPALGSGSTTDIDVTPSFSMPRVPGGQSTAVVTVPEANCALLRLPHIENRHLRVEARMNPSQAFDSTSHNHPFRLQAACGPGAPPPPPPPSPSVSMGVAPMAASVVWGQTATYDLELASQRGFAGPVNLVVDQLPAGVTASLSSSSVTLAAGGPPQTNTLSLATAFGVVPPGSSSFRVRATSSAATVTRNPTLIIARTGGAFVRSTHRSASLMCGADVNATYQNFRVTFEVSNRPSGTVSSMSIPAVFYAYSQEPECRIGVVMHPCQNVACSGAGEPAFSWYNLGWQSSMTGIPQRAQNLTQINWHQFWFSPDQSLLLLITKMQQAVTCPPNCPHLDVRAFVHDTRTGNRLGQVDFRTRAGGSLSDPTADVTSASLSGNIVTIDFVRETGNADTRTITLP